jgi:hypothetical protein
MHNSSLRLLATLAVVLSTMAAGTAQGAAPASAARSCGNVHARGHAWKVTIDRGHVTCHAARRVLNAFLHGKGRMHGPKNGPAFRQYWTLYGWRCGNGAGAAGCSRHHGGDSVLAEVRA